MTGNYDLPQSLREIADVIGRERALELGNKVLLPSPRGKNGNHGRSGCVYVPTVDNVPGSPLERMIGTEDAEKLARAFGGETLWPAWGKSRYLRFRNAAVRERLAQGLNPKQVAWLFDLSERHIRAIRAIAE